MFKKELFSSVKNLGKKSFASEVGCTPKNLLGDLSVHKSISHSSRILQDGRP
jgi:hypothetical protein